MANYMGISEQRIAPTDYFEQLDDPCPSCLQMVRVSSFCFIFVWFFLLLSELRRLLVKFFDSTVVLFPLLISYILDFGLFEISPDDDTDAIRLPWLRTAY
jgi:hypothetical protein